MSDSFWVYGGLAIICCGILYFVLSVASRSSDNTRMVKIRQQAVAYLKNQYGDVVINKIGYHRDGVLVNFSANGAVQYVLYQGDKFTPYTPQ